MNPELCQCSPGCQIPYGLCHCGCGERTNIAKKTDKRRGQVKGEPQRHVHHWRAKPDNKPSRNALMDLYRRKSVDEIAEFFSVARATITRWMIEYGIARRTLAQAARLRDYNHPHLKEKRIAAVVRSCKEHPRQLNGLRGWKSEAVRKKAAAQSIATKQLRHVANLETRHCALCDTAIKRIPSRFTGVLAFCSLSCSAKHKARREAFERLIRKTSAITPHIPDWLKESQARLAAIREGAE